MTQDLEHPSHHLGRRHLERLVMLSDGVFAIAITLSALEIKPETGEGVSLWQAWSLSLLVYFMSFVLIGAIWLVHRRIVSWLNHIDAAGTVISMVLLSLVALVPVVIRYALTHPQRHDGFLAYSLLFVLLYLTMAVLLAYLTHRAKLAVHAPPIEAQQLLAKLGFAVLIFSAAASYLQGWIVLAIICALAAMPLRWLAWRRAPKAAAAG